METKEVFDIEECEINGLNILEYKYITIDGERYIVSADKERTVFWYDY